MCWSGFRQTAPHPYPHYSNIWAYEGQVIWVDLLQLMCRRHVQHGSPQDPNMLKTLTNAYLGHLGDAWCNLQHQAHQSARNQRWQNFSNMLSSWNMGPQYLDSARQNASTYLLSLSSNSTICRSTQGNTYELVSRMCAQSSLRPENPEMPKSGLGTQKYGHLSPPNPYISETAFLIDSKSIHTHPYGTKFWCTGRKIEKPLKKCEFAPCWHIPDVPERCVWQQNLFVCLLAQLHHHLLGGGGGHVAIN